jgi:uncharacterized protein
VLRSLGMAESTFVGNLLCVAALAWVLVPVANRAFDWWLRPAPGSPRWTTSVGVAVVLGLYALSVVVFTWLSCTRRDRSPTRTLKC